MPSPEARLQQRVQDAREGDVSDAHIKGPLRVGPRGRRRRMHDQPQAVRQLRAALRRRRRAAVSAVGVPACAERGTMGATCMGPTDAERGTMGASCMGPTGAGQGTMGTRFVGPADAEPGTMGARCMNPADGSRAGHHGCQLCGNSKRVQAQSMDTNTLGASGGRVSAQLLAHDSRGTLCACKSG